jgi:hypothetical protein
LAIRLAAASSKLFWWEEDIKEPFVFHWKQGSLWLSLNRPSPDIIHNVLIYLKSLTTKNVIFLKQDLSWYMEDTKELFSFTKEATPNKDLFDYLLTDNTSNCVLLIKIRSLATNGVKSKMFNCKTCSVARKTTRIPLSSKNWQNKSRIFVNC